MLSPKAQQRLEIALGNKSLDSAEVAEILSAINVGVPIVASDVAAISPGTVAAITVPDNTQASINTALASAVADMQANRTAINAILTALKAAGLML